MELKNTRIYKLRKYLMSVLDELVSSEEYQINANFLSENIGNYSLDKVPAETFSEKWICGSTVSKEIYELRSREIYGPDVMDNLSSIGFFEAFERKIEDKNNNGELPEIEGIEEIECLNCGALSSADTPDTAVFSVQIQITYLKEDV